MFAACLVVSQEVPGMLVGSVLRCLLGQAMGETSFCIVEESHKSLSWHGFKTANSNRLFLQELVYIYIIFFFRQILLRAFVLYSCFEGFFLRPLVKQFPKSWVGDGYRSCCFEAFEGSGSLLMDTCSSQPPKTAAPLLVGHLASLCLLLGKYFPWLNPILPAEAVMPIRLKAASSHWSPWTS